MMHDTEIAAMVQDHMGRMDEPMRSDVFGLAKALDKAATQPLREKISDLNKKLAEAADVANKWKALRDQLQADIDRPEGRWGMHGHSAVDDDYFAALQYVVARMDETLNHSEKNND